MSRFLIKTTDTYRVDTVSEVEQFHAELKESQFFDLSSFSYTQKQTKQKGEVVDEYCVVKVVKSFNNEKEPTSQIDIEYNNDDY